MMEFYEEIERGLTRTYRKTLWRPFMSSMKEYRLVAPGDHICVCISGGKDSMLLAKLMQEYRRHCPFAFELTFLSMDPGYAPENRRRIEENAALLNIPLAFFETDIFEAVRQMGERPCYMCAKMRRGYLYRAAKARGCNKIALGHHFDDVIETVLMSMFYGGQLRSMPPMLSSDNVPDMALIRPMYRIREEHILRWCAENGLSFLRCACSLTEGLRDGTMDSKRMEIKRLIRTLKQDNPIVDRNIFRSVHNVSLDTMVRWKYCGKEFTHPAFDRETYTTEGDNRHD